MRIAVSGSTGLVGSEGGASLSAVGHEVVRLVRRPPPPAGEPVRRAAGKGVRVLALRIGVVRSPRGGALSRMLPPFRAGLGGVIGNGRQYVSWIALDDLVGVVLPALRSGGLRGPGDAGA